MKGDFTMNIYIEFGKRLAEMRQQINLSQKSIADKLEIPQSTYAGYETGSRKIPLELIVRLSKILNISPTVLILGKEINIINDFTASELELIKKYRQLDADGKLRIENQLNFEVEQLKDKESAPSGAQVS
jgi:transcriptional regulator with XRE-family HTH domain